MDIIKPFKLRIKKKPFEDEEVSNLTVGSEHDILPPPANDTGIWVMGKTKPVRLMPYEYEIIEQRKPVEV